MGRLERWSAYFHRIILSPLIDTYTRRKPTHEEIQDLPVLFAIVEESGLGKRCCFSCVGCRGGRPIRLHVVEEGTDKQVEINKPCRLGGWICSPLEMTVSDTRKSEDVKLGLVKQNFQPYCSRCYEDACRCTFYTDVRTSRTPCTQATKICFVPSHTNPVNSLVFLTSKLSKFIFPVARPHFQVYSKVPTMEPPSSVTMNRNDDNAEEPLFQLKVHTCFCGPNKNSCGGSCCNSHAIYDIYNPRTNELVSNVHKLYAPLGNQKCCKCAPFGRFFGDYDTFLLGFPEGSMQLDRMMLIIAAVQMDFHLFEEGGLDGGGSCAGWIYKIANFATSIIRFFI